MEYLNWRLQLHSKLRSTPFGKDSKAALAGSAIAALLFFGSIGESLGKTATEARLVKLNQEFSQLYSAGRYAEAIPVGKEIVRLNEDQFGKNTINTSASLSMLAELYRRNGDYTNAEPLYRRALDIAVRILPPDDPVVALNLDNLALFYSETGAYKKAEPLYKRSLPIWQKAAPDALDTAVSMMGFGRLYLNMGAYDRAERLLKSSLTIIEKVRGPEDPLTAESLNNLAILYKMTEEYGKAEQLFKRVLKIKEDSLGPEHPDNAPSIYNLAELYRVQGSYREAESLHTRALTLKEKGFGPWHPSTARSVSALASLYATLGQYNKAEELHGRALAIREKVEGREGPETAGTLGDLAELYRAMGAYSKAEPLYEQALAMKEKVLGPQHPAVAQEQNSLAELYRDKGAYELAEPLYQRALKIYEKVLGRDTSNYATVLDNLAMLYDGMGAYTKAEPLHQRSLVIDQQVLGNEHVETAKTASNLGSSYLSSGQFEKANRLFLRALGVFEKNLPPEHPLTATALNNLAIAYQGSGQVEGVEQLYQRILAISEKVSGKEHLDTATSLKNLAFFYHSTGAYDKAEPLYQRALTIEEKVLGPNAGATAETLKGLATLYWAQQRMPEAAELMRRSISSNESAMDRLITLGDESRKSAFVATQTPSSYIYASFMLASRDATGLARVILRKGRVLDLMTDMKAALRRSISPADAKLLAELSEADFALARLQRRPPKESPKQYQEELGRQQAVVAALETQLSERSAAFKVQSQSVTVEGVQAMIPKDAVLIEWFRYYPFNLTAKGEQPRWGKPRYIAYLLKSDGAAVMADIGDADSIEQAVSDFLAALGDPGNSFFAEISRELDEKLIEPLRPHLGGVRHFLLAPDGMLNLIPFGALIDKDQKYLTNTALITYLTSGRDLLRSTGRMGIGGAPVIFADPSYGEVRKENRATTVTHGSKKKRSAATMGSVFTPLPGTAAEAKGLQGILNLPPDHVLTKESASKNALKQVKGPSILHVATHGFFSPDPSVKLHSKPLSLREQLLPRTHNPLLRSGLALAGANSVKRDGIVTSLEMSALDLNGTKLAVLSACETGVGDVQNGEGVYGLRRALVLAGAETQVTSLWKVADQATKDLMVDYYKRLLKGEGRSEALRNAQLAMMKSKDHSHPYYWAAFVAIGDWRPLVQSKQ